jgi:hypothetical protein
MPVRQYCFPELFNADKEAMIMKNRILIVLGLLGLLGLLTTIPVKAFDYIGWGGAPMYDSGYFLNSLYSFASFTNFTTLNNAWDESSDQQGKGLATQASKETRFTRAPAATTSKWPKKLATNFPKEQRKEWQRAFKYSLNIYQKLEKKLRIPKTDIAGAVAAYIAGNYMAYHNSEVSDADFLALVDQMRSLLINIPEFKQAKKSAKRDFYELMAIGGTFMAIASLDLQQQPNQASIDKLRAAAGENLEQFFSVNIDDIQIVDGGLVIH